MYAGKVIVLLLFALFSIAKVRGVDQHIRDTTFSGFGFEMIMAKLEHLQDKLDEMKAAMKQDRENVEQKLAGVARTISQLEKTMDQNLTKQQTQLNQMLQDKMDEMKAAMKPDREIVEQKLAGVARTISQLEKTMDQNLTKQQTQLNQMLQNKWNEMKAAMKQDRENVCQNLASVTRSISQLEKTMDQNLTKQQTQWTEMKAAMKQDREIVDKKLADVTRSIIQQERTMDQCLSNVKTQLNQMLTEQTVHAKRKKMRQEIQQLASKNDQARFRVSSSVYLQSISSRSCKEEPSKRSGKYIIQPTEDNEPFLGYCEQTAFGGGWLVFQYRYDGSVDFYRNWAEYRNGFASMDGEFWLGLEQLHRLTSARKHELLVELKDFDGNYKYARYDEFKIGSEKDQYPLAKLGSYTGTAGESLYYHKGMKFSTKDQDNDKSDSNCAVLKKGAWWYKSCYSSNLNGFYKNGMDGNRIVWATYNSSRAGLAYTTMLIREK